MKRFRYVLPQVLCLLLLAACSGTDVVNALVPEDGYRVVRDVRYGEEPRRQLDIYIPDGASGSVPTVVFFYGGNWQSGSRSDYLFAGEAFASRGYLTAIPDYRLYPQVRYPAFLEDAAAAVAWIKRNPQHSGIEPGPIYLVGHSAGAYIAAMLAIDPSWLDKAGVSGCGTVTAAVGLAGPYDFLPLKSAALKDIFGPEPTRPRTQPINHVHGRAPPLLLVSGSDDTVVLPANSSRLAARVRETGGSAETVFYDGIGHIALAASLAGPLRGLAPTLDDVDAFLRRHSSDDATACNAAS